MRLAKIKEQLIITRNGIFRNRAAIANVQGKRNGQLSLLLEDPVRPCLIEEERQAQEEAVNDQANRNDYCRILGQIFCYYTLLCCNC